MRNELIINKFKYSQTGELFYRKSIIFIKYQKKVGYITHKIYI